MKPRYATERAVRASTSELLLPPAHRVERHERNARYAHVNRTTCPPSLVAELLRHLDPRDAAWRKAVIEGLSEEYGDDPVGIELFDGWLGDALEPGTRFREWSNHALGLNPHASLPALQKLFNRAYNTGKVSRRLWWFAGATP